MIRGGCGSLAGALAHVAAGEKQCGWCARAEAFARLEAEGLPGRTAPAAVHPSEPQQQPAAGGPVPVTAAQARNNAGVIAAETLAYERNHRTGGPLRVIAGGAA